MNRSKVYGKSPRETRPVFEATIRHDAKGFIRCRVCGCTEVDACNPPCGWVPGEADLCTGCHQAAAAIAEWKGGARLANMSALMREVDRIIESAGARAFEASR